jgi:hypothetical protein
MVGSRFGLVRVERKHMNDFLNKEKWYWKASNRIIVSSADIMELESLVGFHMPYDFANFLIDYNGGNPPGHYIDHLRNGEGEMMSLIFNFEKEGRDSIFKESAAMTNILNIKVLAFSEDAGGNCFLLTNFLEKEPAFYFWDHESQNEKENLRERFLDSTLLLARNFEELLSIIVLDEYIPRKRKN